MSYRDDRDADQARIASLQAELANANRRIDELEGKRSQALVRAQGNALALGGERQMKATKWLGAPTHIGFEHTFDGEFPRDRFEDLVVAIREITKDRGTTELMRSSMSWASSSDRRGMGPFWRITLTLKDGATKLEIEDKLGQLAGGIFGGFGGGVGGGALMAPIGATLAVPILAPAFFLAWFGGIYWSARRLYKRSATKRAQQMQLVFDQVVAAVEREMKAPPKSAVDEATATDEPVQRSRDRDKVTE